MGTRAHRAVRRRHAGIFGNAPVKDIARLREDGFAPVHGAD
jgi:hypothetical protein